MSLRSLPIISKFSTSPPTPKPAVRKLLILVVPAPKSLLKM